LSAFPDTTNCGAGERAEEKGEEERRGVESITMRGRDRVFVE
jgi:hypothetical protein